MDAFEIRMEFLTHLSKLTCSLISIKRVTAYAMKYAAKCGEDLWSCLMEECVELNLNSRMNLLYLLDSLLSESSIYSELIQQDLSKLIDLIVPNTTEGILNKINTVQVLTAWKTKRLLPTAILEPIIQQLQSRIAPTTSTSITSFTKADILRRIEDDRERHKRLRERIWVLPIPTTLQTNSIHPLPPLSIKNSPFSPSSPAESFQNRPLVNSLKLRKPIIASTSITNSTIPTSIPVRGTGPELAIEIEFDQLWENAEMEENREKDLERFKRRKIVPETIVIDTVMTEVTGGEQMVGEPKENGRWLLSQEEKDSMKRERDRCFVARKETAVL